MPNKATASMDNATSAFARKAGVSSSAMIAVVISGMVTAYG
jgi:hypothetical protein